MKGNHGQGPFSSPRLTFRSLRGEQLCPRHRPATLPGQPCQASETRTCEWEENLLGKQPGGRKRLARLHRGAQGSLSSPCSCHWKMGEAGKSESQPQSPHPLFLFSQEASTFQTLPGSRRHFHEAVITRTERSSLLEPAGWSLFPLPFVFMHHSPHLLLRFLRALKKPQMLHTVTPPSGLADIADMHPALSDRTYASPDN